MLGIIAWRAGASKAWALAWMAVRRYMYQMVMCPVNVRTARANATTAMMLWVMKRIQRRL
jgi:hypothetical protein